MPSKPKSPIAYNPNLASVLLRVGLAIVFLYAAISALRTPDVWLGYVPNFVSKIIDAKTFLNILSVVQIVLAVMLLSGRYLKYTAVLAAALLFGIVLTNWASMTIVFRDLGLAFMALALVFLE